MFKGIFITASHQERELISISREETSEGEPVALRFVINHKACCGGEVEQAVVAVHGVMELPEFGVCHVIAFGPHLSYSGHSLEHRERAAQALAGAAGEAAQHRRGVLRVSVPVREEPAIEDEDAAYVRPTRGFASVSALKTASQMLQDDERGKIKGDERRRLY